MQTRVEALEAEMRAVMAELATVAELAEEGQEPAEAVGLTLVAELERLSAMAEVERARPEMAQ